MRRSVSSPGKNYGQIKCRRTSSEQVMAMQSTIPTDPALSVPQGRVILSGFIN
jgi:hypothetical protein